MLDKTEVLLFEKAFNAGVNLLKNRIVELENEVVSLRAIVEKSDRYTSDEDDGYDDSLYDL